MGCYQRRLVGFCGFCTPERYPLDLASYDPDGLLELFRDRLVRIEAYVCLPGFERHLDIYDSNRRIIL